MPLTLMKIVLNTYAKGPARKSLVHFVPPTEKHMGISVSSKLPDVQQSLTTSPSPRKKRVHAKSHAIQPGQQEITTHVLQGPAKYMQKKNGVLVGLTDLAGRRVGGHSKNMLTVKEEQPLSALNVAVKPKPT